MIFRTISCLMLLAVQTPNAQTTNQQTENHQAENQTDRRYFAYQRPLTSAAKSGQTCAVLDPIVLAHSAPGTPDLRLYHGNQQIPYSMRASTAPQPRQELAQVINLGMQGGNVTFDAEMPDGRYSTIRMDISARNFVTTVDVSGVDVSGSASAGTAVKQATKLGTYTIFDLTGEKLDRSTVLHLPESNFHFLHFVVHAPIKPRDVGGITITGEPLEQTAYTTISETNAVKQDGHRSVFVVTIPPNVPVDRIEFVPETMPVNFSRGVAVTWRSKISTNQNSSGGEPATLKPTLLEKGIIRRIHSVHNGHRIDDEQFAIDPGYAPDAVPTLMSIAILNGDDLPLTIKTVRLQLRERKLCFDAAAPAPGGGSYTLYYGDSQLASPQYDYASLFQAEEDPAIATLGAEQPNPLLQPRPDRRPMTERYPALLWTALLAVIAVLGMVALRTARRVGA